MHRELLQLDDAGLVRGDEVGYLLFQRFAVRAQLVVGEFLDRGVDGLDLLQIRLDLFAVLVGFRAEEGFDYTCNYIHNAFIVFSVRVLNLTKITSFLELRNS